MRYPAAERLDHPLGGFGLAAGPREPRDSHPCATKLICGTVNQHCLDSRDASANMIYLRHDGHGGFAP